MSFVPNAGNASIDPAKLTYLLVTNLGKAKFFALFEFVPARPRELEHSLRWHVTQRHHDSVYRTVHGTKYVVKCSAPTPNGRDPCILSVWMIDAGKAVPRLVTAYASP